MVVYVYNKKTNEKVETFKNVTGVISDKEEFLIIMEETKKVKKKGIKLVVYGF